MANGKPGDHPITDMLIHGKHPFPLDMENSIRQILELAPDFPDDGRRYVDQVRWEERFFDWKSGKNIEEGRIALAGALEELRKGHKEP